MIRRQQKRQQRRKKRRTKANSSKPVFPLFINGFRPFTNKREHPQKTPDLRFGTKRPWVRIPSLRPSKTLIYQRFRRIKVFSFFIKTSPRRQQRGNKITDYNKKSEQEQKNRSPSNRRGISLLLLFFLGLLLQNLDSVEDHRGNRHSHEPEILND